MNDLRLWLRPTPMRYLILREVFDGYIRRYKIMAPPVKRGAARTIRFDLHGSFCGGFGPQACWKATITATPFAFKQP